MAVPGVKLPGGERNHQQKEHEGDIFHVSDDRKRLGTAACQLSPAITNFCHGMRKSSELRAASWSYIDNFNLGKEAVAATSNGFHKAGTLDGVVEASRILLIALLRPWSKSTKVSAGQSFFWSSSRVTTSPECSSSKPGLGKAAPECEFAGHACAIRQPKIKLENPKTEPHAVVKVFSHAR